MLRGIWVRKKIRGLARNCKGRGGVFLQVYTVVTTHCTTRTGRLSSPVRALTAWPMADSSDTMYRNMVTSVRKLSHSAVATPYRWRTHSVRTKPSGHLRRMTGPSAAKMSSGSADVRAYVTTPWTPAMVASSGYENRMPDPRPGGVSFWRRKDGGEGRGRLGGGGGREIGAAARFPRKH